MNIACCFTLGDAYVMCYCFTHGSVANTRRKMDIDHSDSMMLEFFFVIKHDVGVVLILVFWC